MKYQAQKVFYEIDMRIKKMIAIIDYGGGNVGSVKNALNYIGARCIITKDKDVISNSEKIILPGQGRFKEVMKKLREDGLDKKIISEIKIGKPYLGICIGLQILFETGEEDPDTKGLGLLQGTVPRFKTALKVPQVGWNKAEQKKESMYEIDEEYFYFVHSYYVKPKEEGIILATSNYNVDFACIVEKDNILATQFHPEKSGKAGLKFLERWCKC